MSAESRIGSHLHGIDGLGVLHEFGDIGLRNGKHGRGELVALENHGVLLDGLVGHQVVETDNLHIISEREESGIAVERGCYPSELRHILVDLSHTEAAQRVVVRSRLRTDELRCLCGVADGELALAVLGHIERYGCGKVGIPLVSMHEHTVLTFGQKSEDATLVVVIHTVADVYLCKFIVGEEQLHLHGVEHLRGSRLQSDGLPGNMTVVGGCGHHTLLLGVHHVDVHTEVEELALVGIVDNTEVKELSRIVDILTGLRRQNLLHRINRNGDILSIESPAPCPTQNGGQQIAYKREMSKKHCQHGFLEPPASKVTFHRCHIIIYFCFKELFYLRPSLTGRGLGCVLLCLLLCLALDFEQREGIGIAQ